MNAPAANAHTPTTSTLRTSMFTTSTQVLSDCSLASPRSHAGLKSLCHRVLSTLTLFTLAILLTNCGGGGGSSSGTGNTPPPAATLASIAITPANPAMLPGGQQQFAAEGTYSDGSTKDVTSSATWRSSSPAVATINAAGLATAVSSGATKITAGLDSVSSTTDLTVPALSSLVITPANPTIAFGGQEQFKAEGTYSDGATKDLTSSVTWRSSSPAVATITAAGLATAVTSGATRITAGLSSVSANTVLTVASSGSGIVSISIAPSTAVVPLGAPVQFTATGYFSNGSTENLTDSATWASSDMQFATVNSTGKVTGVADGSLTLTATYGQASGSTMGSASVTVETTSGLPTGVGWHALPSNTELQGSGACPPNNFGGDPFLFLEYCGNVIRSWSGAVADTTTDQLVLFGGGHNNYYGNEIYTLNLDQNPITLTRAKDPTVPTNYSNSSNCIDGIPPGSPDFAPNSRETYEGMAFLPNVDRMMILNGALACLEGDGSTDTWTISLSNLSNSSSWVHENPTLNGQNPDLESGGNAYGNVAAYDPNSGLVFVSDSSAMFTYDYSSNTYNVIAPAQSFITSIYLSGAIDPTRELFVLVGECPGGTCGSGDGVFVADISNPATTTQQDWTTNTMADSVCAEFLAGGTNPISSANPGMTFDSVANDFVAWPNQGDSVYILTPDVANQRLTCTKQTFTGGPPNSAQTAAGPNTSNGTFGRFQYFPTDDVFILINDWNIPAYVLRLR